MSSNFIKGLLLCASFMRQRYNSILSTRFMLLPTFLCTCMLSQPLSAQTDLIKITPELVDRIIREYDEPAGHRVTNWGLLMGSNTIQAALEKLDIVNSFFNNVPYMTDPEHWGLPDYWATPLEFLATYAGDCEDYSIAKYFTLRALGIPDQEMRITYVNALELDQAHMVLTYYGSSPANPLVLDNINTTILPASERGDLAPVYTFNAESVWLAKEKGRGQLVGKSESLDMWSDMLNRLNGS